MEGDNEEAAAAAAISSVLGNDDLLLEILLRLGFPTCLVRAALVSERWLRHASDPTFLRRFRRRHPPRLLGFYVQHYSLKLPCFVPVSQAPELAPAICRAAGSFAAGERPRSILGLDGCRNGRLLVRGPDDYTECFMLSPLLPPGAAIATPLPRVPMRGSPPHYVFLPDLEDGGLGGAVALTTPYIDGRYLIQAFTLRSGVWVETAPPIPARWSCGDSDVLPPVHGKIYTRTVHGIQVLDLATASFSVVQRPDRVRKTTDFKLACAKENNSHVFLIHVENSHLLSIWQHEIGTHSWVLIHDRVCVNEAQNRHDTAVVLGSDDNLEYVFLGLLKTEILICMHLGSKIETVIRPMGNVRNIEIFPLMMIWPPIFPASPRENNSED
ncbi:hypothetical protein ACP70R_028953 [Stipagrostis hirtigluma subsp. patula]